MRRCHLDDNTTAAGAFLLREAKARLDAMLAVGLVEAFEASMALFERATGGVARSSALTPPHTSTPTGILRGVRGRE